MISEPKYALAVLESVSESVEGVGLRVDRYESVLVLLSSRTFAGAVMSSTTAVSRRVGSELVTCCLCSLQYRCRWPACQ
jgi:hypothetical protein